MQEGAAALIYASNNGHLQLVQELLKSGADTEAKDNVMQGDGVGGGVSNEGWMHVWWTVVWIGESGRMQPI